jgi:hypothetical protein
MGRVLKMVLDQYKEDQLQEVDAGGEPTPRNNRVPSKPRPTTETSQQRHYTPPPIRQTPEPDTYLHPEPLPVTEGIDWVAVTLGLLAVAAWGGLIPFFIWVYHNVF